MIPKIAIIGSGNVAETFATAIAQHSELELVGVWGRNTERVAHLASIAKCKGMSDPSEIMAADIYIVMVSDSAVTKVLELLPINPEAIVLHTGGSVGIDAIPSKFINRGVLYPFQTFTAGVCIEMSKVPFLIEASNDETLTVVEKLATKLSNTVARADEQLRAKIHLAGVFACNFGNAMFSIGAEILNQNGASFDLLKPLIEQTTLKALKSQNPATGQTGPARRGDQTTQSRHLGMIAKDERLTQIYKLISDYIWETSKKI